MRLRTYLIFQIVSGEFSNFFVNAYFAYGMRDLAVVPMFGDRSLASDTIATAFLLSSLTVICGAFFIGRDVRAGKVSEAAKRLPGSGLHTLWRAIIFGILTTLAFGLPAILAFAVIWPDGLSYVDFFILKVVYAMTIAVPVTWANVRYAVPYYQMRGTRRATL
jgi:hypothetical protein